MRQAKQVMKTICKKDEFPIRFTYNHRREIIESLFSKIKSPMPIKLDT